MSTDAYNQAGPEKEPMLLLDTTGSMNWPSAQNDSTPRKNTIREAIGLIVSQLEGADSQKEHEEGEDAGGLRTITFADGQAYDIGDLNSENLDEKWNSIRWGGGTWIMPGFNQLLKTYTEEFGGRPQSERPLLLALVITDGEAEDTDAFSKMIAKAGGSMYVVLAIIGYGHEHDKALRAYQQIAQQNVHVKVLPFAGETNPETIASALLRMIE